MITLAHLKTFRGKFEDAHQILAEFSDMQSQFSPRALVWYKLRFAQLLQEQGKSCESLQILRGLLEDPRLSPFVHLLRHATKLMAKVYLQRGQISRGLGVLDLAIDLVPEEDY